MGEAEAGGELPQHARAVVVGGGAQGVGLLYSLTRLGWTDVVLLERTELTAGMTWHAAGLLPLFTFEYAAGQLFKRSVDMYKEMEAEGHELSLHVTGNLRLAETRERMDEFRKYCGIANTIGVPFEMVTPEDIKRIWPLCDPVGLVGGIFHPQDGHIAPADLTQAMAKAARKAGAKVLQHTEATGFRGAGNGEWIVETTRGEVRAEHLVLATGFYAREVGARLGLDLPAMPTEHQYVVFDEHPDLVERHKGGLPELPVLRDADHAYYMREERQGLIVGPYEQDSRAAFVDGVPKGFGRELLQPDLERIMPHLEAATRRVPLLKECGIRQTINGPMQSTPDGNPLVGPAWGLRNVWLSEGHTYGIVGAGGIGRALAEWIVSGEPQMDMWSMDPRRWGDFADKEFVRERNEEQYSHMYILHYPDEERSRGRGRRKSPIHDRLDAMGAVWGQRYGWERPNWFARDEGERELERWSFRRRACFEQIGRECRAVRDGAGLVDLTGMAKFEISGPGAGAWLDGLVANVLPSRDGRIALAHALWPGSGWAGSELGLGGKRRSAGVRSEFTITRLAEDHFHVVSSGAAERADYDLLTSEAPPPDGVEVRNITMERGNLLVAGPKARRILERVCPGVDLSSAAFPWLSARTITAGGVADTRALRISFVGELAWELHHPIAGQDALFSALLEAGEAEGGLAMVGYRALDSLRVEKSYRMWQQDLTADYTPIEAGMARFAPLAKKGAFVGREGLERQLAEGPPTMFATLEVDNAPSDDGRGPVDPWGNEPLFEPGGEETVGRATSGAHGFRVGATLSMGYLEPRLAKPGTELEIELLGVRCPARVVPESPFDPGNERPRALGRARAGAEGRGRGDGGEGRARTGPGGAIEGPPGLGRASRRGRALGAPLADLGGERPAPPARRLRVRPGRRRGRRCAVAGARVRLARRVA